VSGSSTSGIKPKNYREIADDLIASIRSRKVEPGSLLPTERELQSRFGAGRSIVRRALAQVVEEGWGEAIPNRGVMALKGKCKAKSRNIAYVDHCSGFNRNLFVHLSVGLQRLDYHLVLVDSEDHGVEGALEYANQHGFAAAFVWSKVGFANAAKVQEVMAEMPLIALDHSLKTVVTDLFSDDNHHGALAATKHLASLGRKRIGITGFYDMSEVCHDRFGGYLMGLFESGRQPSPRDFLFTATSDQYEADTLNLERRLRDHDRPDALFVLQDDQASAIVEAVDRCGLRVPQDVAIVAFRNDVVPTIGDVALTTVGVEWESYATACIERLVRRLQEPDLAPETFRLPTYLHVRGSCGAPRSDWETSSPSPMLSQAVVMAA
jgi:DNA-binding LacI/PurR family transcriptional regulator